MANPIPLLSTSRLFAYYPQGDQRDLPRISGASQSGNLAILPINGMSEEAAAAFFSINPQTRLKYPVEWINGPEEDSGYVIAYIDLDSDQRKSNTTYRYNGRGELILTNIVSFAVGFRRTSVKTDAAFLSLANSLVEQNFESTSVATNWLNTNGYYTTFGEQPQG